MEYIHKDGVYNDALLQELNAQFGVDFAIKNPPDSYKPTRSILASPDPGKLILRIRGT